MSRIWILTAGKVTAEACTNYPSPPEREFATDKLKYEVKKVGETVEGPNAIVCLQKIWMKKVRQRNRQLAAAS